jgi:hypothetical protein
MAFRNGPEQRARVLHAGIDYIGVGCVRRGRCVLHKRTHGYYIAPTRTEVGKDVLTHH